MLDSKKSNANENIQSARGQDLKGVNLKSNIWIWNVSYWFKKRFIIEQLYDGKCVGCGKINVENNLPALLFHHKNLESKEESWAELRFLKLEEIISIIKKRDLVCLCANCHGLIYSTQFIQNYRDIFSEIGFDQSRIEKAGKFYETLFKNIVNFKLK